MAENKVCPDKNEIPPRGNCADARKKRTISRFETLMKIFRVGFFHVSTAAFLLCLLFASLLSDFVIGEIIHEVGVDNDIAGTGAGIGIGSRSGSGSGRTTDNRSEHLARRLFTNRSGIFYNGSESPGTEESKTGISEGRICLKEHGKRETGDERRRKRKERSEDRNRFIGRTNDASVGAGGDNSGCNSCMREERRKFSLETIKDNILSKLGMTQPPNFKGKSMPKIEDYRLSALLGRRHPQKGQHGIFWVLPEDELDRMQGDGPLNSDPSDKVINKNSDFNSKSNTMRSHGNASDNKHSDTNHFQEGEMFTEEEDDYHARTERIITSSQPHPRVRHSPYVQYFQFSDEIRSSKVKKAVLWVYIRGRDSVNVVGDKITIGIYRILHTGEVGPSSSPRESPVITSVLTDLSQDIPNGKGAWMILDYVQIRNLVAEWFRYPQHNLGIIITADDTNRTNLAVTSHGGNSTAFVPFLEVYVADNKKHRTKRNIGLNCNESSNETRCCRYPLRVNFEEFGWDWVIAPKTYDAYYCSGACPFLFLTRHQHSHVMQLADKPGAGPCCSPRKLSAMSMLYFDQNMNILSGILPDMTVDQCGCA